MRGTVQTQITTIGLDIAKNAFQVYGINASEKVLVRKQLRRSQMVRRRLAVRCGTRSLASRPLYVKPLKGFGDAAVLEIVDNFDGDTYRAV